MSHELKVGDRIKDNNPMKPDRVLTISELQPLVVYAVVSGIRVTRVLKRRIYTDGKPRKSGFSLVQKSTP